MTPEEFAAKMREIVERGAKCDHESTHAAADEFLCKVLEDMGFTEGIDIYRRAVKWYS